MEPAATSLIIIATAAFILPLLAGRLRLPAVVLEILFGILIGPVSGIVESTELLDALAELGFFLLMFLSGFEIDLALLERRGARQILTSLVVFVLILLASFLATGQLGYDIFVMFALATVSVGIVVPGLRADRRTGTALGQSILITALLADFLTLLGVTILIVLEAHGFGGRILMLPAFFIIVAVFLLILRRTAWWFPNRFARLFDIDDPQELGIRASLALMLVFVGLSITFGIEPILGAFLAGTIFASVFRRPGALGQKLSGFSYGFLIPVFFINVGIGFDLDAVREPGALTATLVLVGVAFAVKIVPSVVFLTQRIRPIEALAAGVLLTPGLSLIVAVAELGARLGLIDSRIEASLILLAMATAALAPTLFRMLAPPLPARQAPDS